MEQTLGHRTHTENIRSAAASAHRAIDLVRVEYRQCRLPLPWTVRASLDAARQLRAQPSPDATLFHTQSVGLFASGATRGRPYVISLDATPRQMDSMGRWYRHRRLPEALERAKDAAYRRTLRGASAIVAWSEWTRESLVRDYRLEARMVDVVHPGAGRDFFSLHRRTNNRIPRFLFVGGDFERKGGEQLLQAFDRLAGKAELILVTTASVPPRPGVSIVSDATPGSAQLLSAFAAADVFCLPTLADCTSVAIEEAMAAGLPVITTSVGSNASTVTDGETGLIIEPGDGRALHEALHCLATDGALRERLGRRAREVACERYDASANASRLIDLLASVA